MKLNKFAPVLALAGVFNNPSFAQSMPAELWVGPPIATTANELSRREVVAALERASAIAQAPQQRWAGSADSAGIAVGELARSEVEADLSLYARAGLTNYDSEYDSRQHFEPFSAESIRRNLMYTRMRNGPEYVAEVYRFNGHKLPRVADASASEASSE